MSVSRPALLLFLGVFAVALGLFTRRNDFPFYYHPDEPRKVRQLIQNKRNLHHPLLMLTSADLARRVLLHGESKRDPHRVIVVGRWTTAVFAALAAAALATLAFCIHGAMAGVAVGAICVINPLLFELAHYFKEDPYLAAGIALTCLALHRAWVRPEPRSFVLLGAATALAAAGKYIGFALVPFVALAAGLIRPVSLSNRQRWGSFFGAFAIVWLALNWWVFKGPVVVWESLTEETRKAYGGEEGPTLAVPHSLYLMVQSDYSTPLLWIGAGIWLLLVLVRRVKTSPAELLLLSLAVLLFAALSFTPKTSPRYYLPVSLAVSYFAAMGAMGLAALIPASVPMGRTIAAGALALCLFVPELSKWRWRFDAFAQDDRQDLIQFISANLPPSARIAQDEATNLPEPERRSEHRGRAPLPQLVVGEKQIADRATLAALRAEGFTHLAICGRTYLRFLGGGDSPERRFYQEALERGTVLFSRDPGRVTYLQPGLKLIDITQLK